MTTVKPIHARAGDEFVADVSQGCEQVQAVEHEEQEEPEPLPDTAPKWKELGDFHHRNRRFEQAILCYNDAIRLSPTDSSYLLSRAASYMALPRYYPDALADTRLAASMQSSGLTPQILIRLAKCHVLVGDLDKALELANAASVQSGGSDGRATSMVDRITLLKNSLSKYWRLRRGSLWLEATQVLQDIFKGLYGEPGAVWLRMEAETCIGKGDFERGLSLMKRVVDIEPETPETLYFCAFVHFVQNDFESATNDTMRILEVDPTHVKADALLRHVQEIQRLAQEGRVAVEQGRLDEAANIFSDALTEVGDHDLEKWVKVGLLTERAAVLYKAGRFNEANNDLPEAKPSHPWTCKILRLRGEICFSLGDFVEATLVFSDAWMISSDPVEKAEMMAKENEAFRRMVERPEEPIQEPADGLDYYQLLDVPADATSQRIESAFRHESLVHHPDKRGDPEMFKLLQTARNTLTSPLLRREYDRTRAKHRRSR